MTDRNGKNSGRHAPFAGLPGCAVRSGARASLPFQIYPFTDLFRGEAVQRQGYSDAGQSFPLWTERRAEMEFGREKMIGEGELGVRLPSVSSPLPSRCPSGLPGPKAVLSERNPAGQLQAAPFLPSVRLFCQSEIFFRQCHQILPARRIHYGNPVRLTGHCLLKEIPHIPCISEILIF